MLGAAPFKPRFLEFCAAVNQVVPAGDRILVEPYRVVTTAGRARWYIYLNLELHPRQVFVRAPELASGTLVDYPRWLNETQRPLGLVEAIELDNAVDDLGIRWRIRYSAVLKFARNSATLERRVKGGWEPVALPDVRFDYGKVVTLGAASQASAGGDGADTGSPTDVQPQSAEARGEIR